MTSCQTIRRAPGGPGAWSRGLLLLGLLAACASARAQSPLDAGVAPGEAQAAKDSPRASLARFLELCREGQYQEAAGYLDLPLEAAPKGAALARKLEAVLARHSGFDLSLVSPLSGGKDDDGLPHDTEEIGQVPGPAGTREPVRLVRSTLDAGRWVFSRATTGRIETWYESLEHRWLFEHLPPLLLRAGPKDLLYWQWLAMPVLFVSAWLLGVVLSRLSRRLLSRLAGRTATSWDDEVLVRLAGPLTFAWTLAAAYFLVPRLGLFQPAEDFVHRWLRAGFFVVFFWALARLIDVARQILAESPWAKDHPSSRSLLPLGARLGKVAVSAIAVVALLSELGYPVASLIAGLGIGGLAVALAAQKTVENLFGAFSIGADEPFREGDFVRVEDFVGTVEAIGLRSTRIRTLDRTLISIPNGRLAEMRLETFAARDRIRLACTVGLVYGTSATQLREVLAGLERVLREHPRIWPEAVIVRFKEFGASSLDIEVMAWFQTPDWGAFQLIRQDVLLQFMEVVEKAGSSFAFPTRTVHLVTERGGA